MNIRVTKHCIEQVKMRKFKGKHKDIKSTMFAIGVFTEMMNTGLYKGTKVNKYNGKDKKKIISHKETGYKFVYIYDLYELEYILITFTIHTELDFAVSKILKNLHIN